MVPSNQLKKKRDRLNSYVHIQKKNRSTVPVCDRTRISLSPLHHVAYYAYVCKRELANGNRIAWQSTVGIRIKIEKKRKEKRNICDFLVRLNDEKPI